MEDGLIAFINDTIMFSILPPKTPNTLFNIRNYSDPCGKAPNLFSCLSKFMFGLPFLVAALPSGNRRHSGKRQKER